MKKVLSKLWAGWKRLAHAFGRMQTRVLLTLFYFVVLSPLGALMRVMGWDPLHVRPGKAAGVSNWKQAQVAEPDLQSLRRQS